MWRGPVWFALRCQLATRNPNLWVGGNRVLVVWDEPMPGVGRPWLECPRCGRRSRHLYLRSRSPAGDVTGSDT
jgi:hypothetical protein